MLNNFAHSSCLCCIVCPVEDETIRIRQSHLMWIKWTYMATTNPMTVKICGSVGTNWLPDVILLQCQIFKISDAAQHENCYIGTSRLKWFICRCTESDGEYDENNWTKIHIFMWSILGPHKVLFPIHLSSSLFVSLHLSGCSVPTIYSKSESYFRDLLCVEINESSHE